jgi:DNA-binding response OmpR family regulator
VLNASSSGLDILLIGPEWPTRALLRAQLIEDGYEVAALDDLPVPLEYLDPDRRPRLVIVDLQGLTGPDKALEDLRIVFGADLVLVIAALGSVRAEDLRAAGFHTIARPTSVGDVVGRVKQLLGDRV